MTNAMVGGNLDYHHDALGSIVGVSDSTYAVWKSFLYDEFGDSLGAWGATSINNYRYTGQEWDGMPMQAYNLRAREYYPKVGRFMQNDPIGDKGGSLNWYSYVANNPINKDDPTGKQLFHPIWTPLLASGYEVILSYLVYKNFWYPLLTRCHELNCDQLLLVEIVPPTNDPMIYPQFGIYLQLKHITSGIERCDMQVLVPHKPLTDFKQ